MVIGSNLYGGVGCSGCNRPITLFSGEFMPQSYAYIFTVRFVLPRPGTDLIVELDIGPNANYRTLSITCCKYPS